MQKIKTTALPILAGIFVAVGGVQYVVLEAVAASAWHNPPYSYAVNFISDLGNPVPHDVFNHTLINSPLNLVMDIAFFVQGILFILATLLVWRRVPGRVKGLILALGIIHGVGIMMVGTFHENSTVPFALIFPHFVGAFAAILGSNFDAIVFGIIATRLSGQSWYRVVSVVLGIIGIAAFAWLEGDRAIYTTNGGTLERVAVYAPILWEVISGVALMVAYGRRRNRVDTLTA